MGDMLPCVFHLDEWAASCPRCEDHALWMVRFMKRIVRRETKRRAELERGARFQSRLLGDFGPPETPI